MKRIFLFLAVASYAVNSQAVNASNVYWRLDTGYSWSSNMNKDMGNNNAGSSAIVGMGLGYHINDHLRTDATLGYRGWYRVNASEPVSGTTFGAEADIKSLVGLLNIYYDIGHYNVFTPYVGGGVGFSNNKVESTALTLGGTGIGNIDSHTNTSFAWQFGAGTAVDITPSIALDIGYRYVDMGTAQTGDMATISGTPISGATTKGNLHANEVQAGIRVNF